MTADRRLGILGGTLDPPHYGHLDAAEAARAALALDEILFVPSADPPHRATDPLATPLHRFALVALAVAGHEGYRVSDLELTRAGPSYTADTLRALHAEGWRASQLFFIIGSDAFADIATWREYPAIMHAANFAIVARPGTTLETALAHAPELRPRVCASHQGLLDAGRTAIFLVEARTRDVSSSAIRARLAARQPIGDLVPASVAQHIAAHHLYGAVDSLHG
jgi:nicotinate-nucleotide adenylyltransferase